MKYLLAVAVVLLTVASASAGVTCVRYGNSITCTGDGGTTTCHTYGNVTSPNIVFPVPTTI